MLSFAAVTQPDSRLSCQITVTDDARWPGGPHAGRPALDPLSQARPGPHLRRPEP